MSRRQHHPDRRCIARDAGYHVIPGAYGARTGTDVCDDIGWASPETANLTTAVSPARAVFRQLKRTSVAPPCASERIAVVSPTGRRPVPVAAMRAVTAAPVCCSRRRPRAARRLRGRTAAAPRARAAASSAPSTTRRFHSVAGSDGHGNQPIRRDVVRQLDGDGRAPVASGQERCDVERGAPEGRPHRGAGVECRSAAIIADADRSRT